MSKSSLPVPETASGRAIREMQEHERRVREAFGGYDEIFKQQKLAQDALSAFGGIEEFIKQQKLAQSALGAVAPSRAIVEFLQQQGLASDLAKGSAAASASAAVADYVRQHNELANAAASYGGYSSAPSTSAAPPPPQATTITTAADIGALVRKARKGMKMNQSEFALHAGVGRRFLSELENGKASLEFDKVVACAAAAGIDLIPKVRRGA